MRKVEDPKGKYIPLGIKHADRSEIFGAVRGLPPWLDGPRIKAKAEREGITYDEAKEALSDA